MRGPVFTSGVLVTDIISPAPQTEAKGAKARASTIRALPLGLTAPSSRSSKPSNRGSPALSARS